MHLSQCQNKISFTTYGYYLIEYILLLSLDSVVAGVREAGKVDSSGIPLLNQTEGI